MFASDFLQQKCKATKILQWHISCLHEGPGEWPDEGWQLIPVPFTHFCLFTHKSVVCLTEKCRKLRVAALDMRD